MALSERTKEILKSGYDYQGLAVDMYEDKCDNCIELQKRIDKAIEYIENEETYEEGYCDGRLMIYKDRLEYELLNILRGKDNDSKYKK